MRTLPLGEENSRLCIKSLKHLHYHYFNIVESYFRPNASRVWRTEDIQRVAIQLTPATKLRACNLHPLFGNHIVIIIVYFIIKRVIVLCSRIIQYLGMVGTGTPNEHVCAQPCFCSKR